MAVNSWKINIGDIPKGDQEMTASTKRVVEIE
jgi:hypothetical protein